jgi:sigma-B regulation protein RsbU (phosphoserine phosphatase)
MNQAGDFFSEERLEQALACADGSSPEETTRSINQEVRRFADGAPQSDDLTMLLVKYC